MNTKISFLLIIALGLTSCGAAWGMGGENKSSVNTQEKVEDFEDMPNLEEPERTNQPTTSNTQKDTESTPQKDSEVEDLENLAWTVTNVQWKNVPIKNLLALHGYLTKDADALLAAGIPEQETMFSGTNYMNTLLRTAEALLGEKATTDEITHIQDLPAQIVLLRTKILVQQKELETLLNTRDQILDHQQRSSNGTQVVASHLKESILKKNVTEKINIMLSSTQLNSKKEINSKKEKKQSTAIIDPEQWDSEVSLETTRAAQTWLPRWTMLLGGGIATTLFAATTSLFTKTWRGVALACGVLGGAISLISLYKKNIYERHVHQKFSNFLETSDEGYQQLNPSIPLIENNNLQSALNTIQKFTLETGKTINDEKDPQTFDRGLFSNLTNKLKTNTEALKNAIKKLDTEIKRPNNPDASRLKELKTAISSIPDFDCKNRLSDNKDDIEDLLDLRTPDELEVGD